MSACWKMLTEVTEHVVMNDSDYFWGHQCVEQWQSTLLHYWLWWIRGPILIVISSGGISSKICMIKLEKLFAQNSMIRTNHNGFIKLQGGKRIQPSNKITYPRNMLLKPITSSTQLQFWCYCFSSVRIPLIKTTQ